MDAIPWVLLGMVISAIAAIPVVMGLRARMTAVLEKERRAREDAAAALDRERRAMDDRVKTARESARREALDEFVRELRVEERSRVRQARSMFSARRIVTYGERLCFGDQPLSNWVEQEAVLEEGIEAAPRPQSVFLAAPSEAPQPEA